MTLPSEIAHLAESPLVDEEGQPVPQRHVEHLERWLTLAEALPVDEVRSPNGEGSLVVANAHTIQANLAPHQPALAAMTHVDRELVDGIHSLALAYSFAAALWRVTQPQPKPALGERMRSVRRSRNLLLHVARAASVKGWVSEKTLEAVEEGRGPVDAVQDVATLGAILRRDAPAVLAAGGFISEQELAEAERLAAEVAAELRPSSAPRPAPIPDAHVAAVTLMRNRLWSLLVKAHEQCQLAAASLVGMRRVTELVPGLVSRRGLPKKPPAET
jgi:hypothetical protein